MATHQHVKVDVERHERRLRADGGLAATASANEVIDWAPDPAAARRLRDHLAVQRRRGVPFEQAWRTGLDVALAGLPEGRGKMPHRDNQASWRTAFESTRDAWARAYHHQDVATTPLFVPEAA